MGMFDQYEPMPALHCPQCGSELKSWQGKDGPCRMLTWTQGEPRPEENDDPKEWRLPSGEGHIYTRCDGLCERWVDATIVVKEGVWVETRLEPRVGD